jgi:hypothetical protein
VTSTGSSAEQRASSDWTLPRLKAAVASVPMAVWVAALVVASTVGRFLVARGVEAPFIFQDELLYSELAKSLGTSGHFALRGVPGLAGLSPVYPILISPAYALFTHVPDAYSAAKLLNAFYVSLAAVPAYLVARRLVAPVHALFAAVLVLAVPDLLLVGTLMTENAFYPIFLLWFVVLVRMLERPTIVNQIAVLVLILLAYETRPQALLLAPALLTAVVTMVVADATSSRSWQTLVERARGYWVTLLLVVGGAALYALVEGVLRGRAIKQSLLKTYAVLGDTQYTVGGVAKWFLYLVGELVIVVGVFPFAAFVVIAVVGLSKRRSTPALRAFAAGAIAASFWILLGVAAFSSTPYAQRLEERNAFYVMPLLLISLVVWAARYAGRFPRVTGVGAMMAVAATGLVPVAAFLTPNAFTDSFGLLAVWRLQIHYAVPGEWLSPIIILLAIAAGILFIVIPARFAMAVPVVVFVFLAFGNREADMFLTQASTDSRNGAIQVPVDWVDRAVGSDAEVAALFSNARPPATTWLNEFFNRSVGPLYNFVSSPLDGLPQKMVQVDRRSGRLKIVGGGYVRAKYVLSDNTQVLAGKILASDPGVGMRVYGVNGPVRVVGSLGGIYPDQWSGSSASILAYACHGGHLRLLLAGEPRLHPRPVTVVASSEGQRLAKLVVQPGFAGRRYTIPLVARGNVCQVDFSVHPTAVPAERLRSEDTRSLGVRFLSFNVEP